VTLTTTAQHRATTPGTVTRSQYRVLVVEGQTLFAEALELALSIEGYDVRSVSVPPRQRTPETLLTVLLRQRPRLVLLDLELAGAADCAGLVRPLAAAGIDVVGVTALADRAHWGAALAGGARAVLSKSGPLRGTIAAVRRISLGQPVLTHEEREELVRAWYARRAERSEVADRMARLSPRESQVLGHLMRGRTVHEIAAAAVVSPATVRTQVKSILAKLDVSSQPTAVGLAYQVGWQPPAA
jgi:DNA-binding NarL/FixJ family response regulator